MVAAIALLAVLSTGCFALRGFTFSKPIIAPGEKTVLNMRLAPGTKYNGPYKDYVFVIVGVDNDSDNNDEPVLNIVKPRKFDTGHNFGATTRTLLRDDDLRDLIFTEGYCDSRITPSSGTNYLLFRTPTEVKDQGRLAKYALTQLGLKANPDTAAFISNIQIVSGAWDDDGDNNPEATDSSDDSYICTGNVETTYPIKNPSNP
jgi:hypothetical protein